MEEENFEKLYNESLNEKKFDKRITGTVIQISRKGEIFVDFKYKADGIIPRKEYSDDETKNPKDEFKPGDTITADVIKWNDGLGNVLLSYKKYRREEDKKIERELKIKQAEEIKRQKIERAKNIEEFWNNIKIGKAYKGTVSKIVDYGIFVDLGVVTGLAHKSELVWDKNEKIEVNTIEQTIKNIQHRYSASINALYMTSAILFVFGSISLTNMLMVDFQNRKREFGLLEAVGTTRQQLKAMLDREMGIYLGGSLVIALVFGSILSVIVCRRLDAVNHCITLVLPWLFLLALVVVLAVIYLIFTAYAKSELKKTSILSAIREE